MSIGNTQAKPGEWITYNGDIGGNRYSKLNGIDLTNVGKLQLKWTYSLAETGLQTTPLMQDGLMFVCGTDRRCAVSHVVKVNTMYRFRRSTVLSIA